MSSRSADVGPARAPKVSVVHGLSSPPDGSPATLSPLERDDQILDQEPVAAKAAQKVALDLDGAPFLQDDLPADKGNLADKAPTPVKQIAAEPEDSKKGRPSRKLIMLGILFGVLAVLILAAAATFWLIKPAAPPEQVELPLPPPPQPDKHYTALEPFWVAFDQGDEVRFLSLKMTLVTEDPMLSLEIQRKNIILRDAAYYFLNHRPLPTVKQADAADALKDDLLSVLNQHLSRPLDGVLIEEFLVR